MTDLSPTHTMRLLPCPFCGALPRSTAIVGHQMWQCGTVSCPVAFTWVSLDVWNRRAPVATSAGVDASQMCIVDAQRTMRGHLGDVFSYDQASVLRLLERQRSADRSLAKTLNALASPAPTPPPSLAFWLGADA